MLKVKLFKGMGRGLVSCKPIKKGQVIHIAEIIHLNPKDAKTVSRTLLDSYVYAIKGQSVGIALGLGSLFNHAEDNNTNFEVILRQNRYMIKYTAKRDIKKGEQLFLNYGYTPKG